MSLDAIGFVLSIAGCPYLFSTGGLPSLTSSSPLWFGAEADVAVLDGFLAWPRGWSERCAPLDGDYTGSTSCTFTLHDGPAPSGFASGRAVLTYLSTRLAAFVTSTPLTADITDADTSIDVANGALLDPTPRWVWIERECIRVGGRSSDTLTGCTRAALGTKAVAHVQRDGGETLPEVFADIPWLTRRKAVLWAIERSGVATPLWIGFAVRAPELAPDGARFDISCDSLWTVLAQAPVGNPDALLAVSGFGRNTVDESGAGSPPTVARIGVAYGLDATTAYASAGAVYRDLDAVGERLRTALYAQTLAVLGTQIEHVEVSFSGASITVILDHGASFGANLHAFGANASAAATPRGSRWTAVLSVEAFARSKYIVLNMGNGAFIVDSLANVPSSWATETTTVGGFTTHRTPTLRGAIDKDTWLVVSGITTTDTAPNGPTIAGATELLPRKAGVEVPDLAYLTNSTGFNVCNRVVTDHWLDGLRYGAADLLADAVADDFDWSTSDEVRRITAGLRCNRDWLFDGAVTFGRVAIECCQLFGCTPVTRCGRMAFFPWQWPDARAVATVSIEPEDIIGSPTWLTFKDGLSNRIRVESDDLTINATDAGSLGRYGPGRQLKIGLLGRDTAQDTIDDPIAFSRQVLQRMGLWSEPLAIVRVKTTLKHITDLELGKQFSVTDWVAPNGTGTRGLSGAVAIVVARDIMIEEHGEGSITLDGLLFPRASYGYAPAGRVSSQTAPDTVVLDQSFVQATAGYSGGDDTATFEPGDEVQLVTRDDTTFTFQDLTVDSVDLVGHSVTFQTAINGTLSAAIASGMVDLRFAHFGTVQTSQSQWMYVGDLATRLIDGTSEPARPIAP